MKTNIIIYVLSLIILILSIILVIEFPDSGRIQLIAGGLILVGIALNIISYMTKK